MQQLIDDYLSGADAMARAVVGMSADQLRARPIAGKWSTLEVVCHLSDSELIFAERMKRILIEDEPPLRFFDPNACVATLAYQDRNVDDEVALIRLVRRHMACILQRQPLLSWQRQGIHNQEGPRTLEQVVQKSIDHLRHHIATIEEKRRELSTPAPAS